MSELKTRTLPEGENRTPTSVSLHPIVTRGVKRLQMEKAEFRILSFSQIYELAAIEFLKKHGITKLD